MNILKIQDTTIQDIADAIREKTNTLDAYTPLEMPEAIRSISGGGSASTEYTEFVLKEIYSDSDSYIVPKEGYYLIYLVSNGTKFDDDTIDAHISISTTGKIVSIGKRQSHKTTQWQAYTIVAVIMANADDTISHVNISNDRYKACIFEKLEYDGVDFENKQPTILEYGIAKDEWINLGHSSEEDEYVFAIAAGNAGYGYTADKTAIESTVDSKNQVGIYKYKLSAGDILSASFSGGSSYGGSGLFFVK